MKQDRMLRAALLALPLLASAGAGADEAGHRQEVETLFRLTQMERKVDESVDNLLAMQMRQSPELTPRESVVRGFLDRNIGWQALRPDLTAMYLAAFTEEELKQINAFYVTPVGQKVLTRVPELVEERNRLAARRLEEHIGELQQELESAAGAQ
jgi:hypothetical protein